MTNPSRETTILLVSNNQADIHEVKKHLEKTMGIFCNIRHSPSIPKSVDYFRTDRQDIDIVLLDLGLVAVNSPHESFRQMQDIAGAVPIIVFTEREDHELALMVIDEGAADNVTRGQFSTDPYKLRDAIRFSIARAKISRKTQQKNAADYENLEERGAADLLDMKEHGSKDLQEAGRQAAVVLEEALEHGKDDLKKANRYAAVTLKQATEHGAQNLKEAKAEAVANMKEATEKSDGRHKELELASQAKSEFLANMSHELRTPLNSIIGLTRMLYEGKNLIEEDREMVGIVYRSANNLLDIVNDILDLSKVEAGKLILEHITFSLFEVVDNTMESVLPLSSEKGLVFSCNYSSESMPYFLGDPVRLGRVLTNLVSNAIKYTEVGSVIVDISCRPDGIDRAIIECSVTDTGIGIPINMRDMIFEKFAQADTSITRRYGGTGLGLSITKQIVEKMGGTIGLESEEGKGSRFWFKIPFVTSEIRPLIDKRIFRGEYASRLPENQRKKIGSIQVLVAEDHLLNLAFMQKLLPRMGISNYKIVENGREAIEAIDKINYDIILMDCHMPVMSGYDATKFIRDQEKARCSTDPLPIVAMTADAMVGTRERCLMAGMDDYISKPINPDELRHILAHWFTFDDEVSDNICEISHEDGMPLVDLSILKEFSDDEGELQNFIEMFLTQSAQGLAILQANCSDGENMAWVDAAHKLKGGAGMFKAEKFIILCSRAQGMQNATAHDRTGIFKDIEGAFNNIKKSLMVASNGGNPS